MISEQIVAAFSAIPGVHTVVLNDQKDNCFSALAIYSTNNNSTFAEEARAIRKQVYALEAKFLEAYPMMFIFGSRRGVCWHSPNQKVNVIRQPGDDPAIADRH
ncbi:MAG: hypothetical protein A2W35_06515 [Chloroflexi bacterium RBG_16_57_11]|nr:MAG: hypothetical protein A2W35_06515 [Chloroflexi bacterium RBG_16_57_11]